MQLIKMNKKHAFEAFKIPEDGVVNLLNISNWLDGNAINMSDIQPGKYIIKDSQSRSTRVNIIDEDELNRLYIIDPTPDDIKEENDTPFYEVVIE